MYIQVTLNDAVKFLGDYKEIQNSHRILGQMNDKDLVLTAGRFGPYLRNGDLIWYLS
jgi:topoisomerase IA-like protein